MNRTFTAFGVSVLVTFSFLQSASAAAQLSCDAVAFRPLSQDELEELSLEEANEILYTPQCVTKEGDEVSALESALPLALPASTLNGVLRSGDIRKLGVALAIVGGVYVVRAIHERLDGSAPVVSFFRALEPSVKTPVIRNHSAEDGAIYKATHGEESANGEVESRGPQTYLASGNDYAAPSLPRSANLTGTRAPADDIKSIRATGGREDVDEASGVAPVYRIYDMSSGAPVYRNYDVESGVAPVYRSGEWDGYHDDRLPLGIPRGANVGGGEKRAGSEDPEAPITQTDSRVKPNPLGPRAASVGEYNSTATSLDSVLSHVSLGMISAMTLGSTRAPAGLEGKTSCMVDVTHGELEAKAGLKNPHVEGSHDDSVLQTAGCTAALNFDEGKVGDRVGAPVYADGRYDEPRQDGSLTRGYTKDAPVVSFVLAPVDGLPKSVNDFTDGGSEKLTPEMDYTDILLNSGKFLSTAESWEAQREREFQAEARIRKVFPEGPTHQDIEFLNMIIRAKPSTAFGLVELRERMERLAKERHVSGSQDAEGPAQGDVKAKED